MSSWHGAGSIIMIFSSSLTTPLKAGAHIVGYANIGEICFRWTAEEKEVFQRLWWRPDDTECPTMATEYQEALDLPEADEAPELPYTVAR